MRFCPLIIFCGLAWAQPKPVVNPQPNPLQGAELAEHGRCQEALPLLRRSLGRPAAKESERRTGFSGVRCAMALNSPVDAVHFIDWLNHEFPHDPEVLFVSVHVYSDLSIHASQELLQTNPGSAQVHQLNAESLEMQGDWKHAMEEYRTVLERDPNAREVHYRIGRLILSQPKTDTTFADARKEFEAELRIDPDNAGAEYVLGEIARQEEQFPEAVEHFTKAVHLDAGFADAYIGLGRALMSSERVAEAIAPLQGRPSWNRAIPPRTITPRSRCGARERRLKGIVNWPCSSKCPPGCRRKRTRSI